MEPPMPATKITELATLAALDQKGGPGQLLFQQQQQLVLLARGAGGSNGSSGAESSSANDQQRGEAGDASGSDSGAGPAASAAPAPDVGGAPRPPRHDLLLDAAAAAAAAEELDATAALAAMKRRADAGAPPAAGAAPSKRQKTTSGAGAGAAEVAAPAARPFAAMSHEQRCALAATEAGRTSLCHWLDPRTECLVECGTAVGAFSTSSERVQCLCAACAERGEGPVTQFLPSEFERHAGMAACKKWRFSVKVCNGGPGMTLGRWLDMRGVSLSSAFTKNGRGSQQRRFKALPGYIPRPGMFSELHEQLKATEGAGAAGAGAVPRRAALGLQGADGPSRQPPSSQLLLSAPAPAEPPPAAAPLPPAPLLPPSALCGAGSGGIAEMLRAVILARAAGGGGGGCGGGGGAGGDPPPALPALPVAPARDGLSIPAHLGGAGGSVAAAAGGGGGSWSAAGGSSSFEGGAFGGPASCGLLPNTCAPLSPSLLPLPQADSGGGGGVGSTVTQLLLQRLLESSSRNSRALERRKQLMQALEGAVAGAGSGACGGAAAAAAPPAALKQEIPAALFQPLQLAAATEGPAPAAMRVSAASRQLPGTNDGGPAGGQDQGSTLMDLLERRLEARIMQRVAAGALDPRPRHDGAGAGAAWAGTGVPAAALRQGAPGSPRGRSPAAACDGSAGGSPGWSALVSHTGSRLDALLDERRRRQELESALEAASARAARLESEVAAERAAREAAERRLSQLRALLLEKLGGAADAAARAIGEGGGAPPAGAADADVAAVQDANGTERPRPQ